MQDQKITVTKAKQTCRKAYQTKVKQVTIALTVCMVVAIIVISLILKTKTKSNKIKGE